MANVLDPVANPIFAKKYGLFTDDSALAPMSHTLEFRDVALHCNIDEYAAKSCLEHIVENIGDRMRTQPQVELSLGVGVVSCKHRFLDGHMTQKQPVQMESEVRGAEPTPQKPAANPRSLMASSKTFSSYIVPTGHKGPSSLVPTKPSSPTTSLIDKDASPRKPRIAHNKDVRPTSPRLVLRQKFLSRSDELPTTVLATTEIMPWNLNPNQRDRMDTVKQLDAKYPPLLDPFCRTLGVEQVDVVNKLTSSERIGVNYSLSASHLVIRKNHHAAHGLIFIDDESSRVQEHFVTLRPPSPVHDKGAELPLVTTSGKPVYAADGVVLTLSRTRSLDGEKSARTSSQPPSLSPVEVVERYLHYLDKIIDDSDIVPMNPTWTEHIQALIARAVNKVQSRRKDVLLASMFAETLQCYTYSIKKAILDYLLLRHVTQVRLGIPGGVPLEFQAHDKWKWGQTHATLISVTPGWKERKTRAEGHVKQFLMLIDTHLMALHYMWGDFDDLLLVDVPTSTEMAQQLAPIDIRAFEKRQMAHAATVKRTLMDKWFAKAKRILTAAKNDEVLESALLNPKHYFDCIATLMSLQLRRLVVRSIDAYVAFFKAYALDKKEQSTQGLLLSLVLDQTKIRFDMALEDVQLSLMNILYNIPSCVTHIDRVETKFEPSIILGGSPFLWAVGLHEEEVVGAADAIRSILQDNMAHAQALRTKYSKYTVVAAGDLPLEHFIAQTHDIPSYTHEVQKFIQFACQIANEKDHTESSNGLDLFHIDCTQLNAGLLQKASHFIHQLFHAFSDTTLRLNRDIRQQFKLIAGRLARKPIDLHELVESEAYISKLRNHELLLLYDNVDNVKQRLQFLFKKCTVVQQCPAIVGLSVSSELLASISKTFTWKHQIEKILRDGDFSLQHERSRIETAFIAKRSRFQAELEELEAEVNSFQKKSDLRHATTYVVQLGKVRDAITQARNTINIIAEEEAKLGWVQTDFMQLDYICETLEPYEQLWRTARDFRESSVKWMRGNIFELDAKGTEKTVHGMTTTLTNATKQLASTSPAAVGAAETLKKQIFEFKDSIGIISVMGNTSLRDRHWTEIAETVGFIVDPTEHITLQRLLDLGVQDSVHKLLDISEAATNEADIERSLDTMSEEWLHMEYKFVVASDTFVLGESVVDDIHIKLDDHIVKTQTIRCSQYRKPFFGRAIAWERSLLKLRDITDLLWQTGNFWRKMEPLFSAADTVHAILDKASNEAKKFTIVDGHWRSIISAVVARPLCLAAIQIDKATERLRECLVLLDAILEGLTVCLEAKRALFSRFYFLSNAELIAALSVSPTALHTRPTSTSKAPITFLGRLFPGVGRVEMNGSREVTHVVSTFEEPMQLCQVVATDKVSTDAWLGRLELQLQTAVQVMVRNALNDYGKKDFRKWTSCWPEQMVLSVEHYMWGMHIEKIMQDPSVVGQSSDPMLQMDTANNPSSTPTTVQAKLEAYLANEIDGRMYELVAELSDASLVAASRINVLTNLITQMLHARDVTADLIEQRVTDSDGFAWQSQLRYAWNDGNLHLKLIKSSIPYGYEYVGNRAALVMLPNTLKCARVLFSAFSMARGTILKGSAGAGKTSLFRSLATSCAKLFVLFSCVVTSSVDELTRLLKGVASCGAWFCLDDVQNIVFHHVGVVMESIQKIQEANHVREASLVLQGVKLRLKRGGHIMATFQPSDAKPHLPIFFKGLFRPVVVVAPSLRHVAQVLFFVGGFSNPPRLGQLVEYTLTMAEGTIGGVDATSRLNLNCLRNVHTIVKRAKLILAQEHTGALRPEKVTLEELVVTHVMAEVLRSQIPESALFEFNGLIKDMLRHVSMDSLKTDVPLSMDAVKLAVAHKEFVCSPALETKLNQLHDALRNHSGVLLLGAPNCGKTALYQILGQVYKVLDERIHAFSRRTTPRDAADLSSAIQVIAPRSITLGQLYGSMASTTKTFQDGILTQFLRKLNGQGDASTATPPPHTAAARSWLVLDGDVDPFWADGFNTLLDDTAQLLVVTGEAIPLPPQARLIFESSDAGSASPSMVSRCAIVYVGQGVVTWRTLYAGWIERLPEYLEAIDDIKEALDATLDMIEPALEFVRIHFQPTMPQSDVARVNALLSLMDGAFRATHPKMSSMTAKQNYTIAQCIFLQSLVWGVGHTTVHDERVKFDTFLRSLAGEATSATPSAATSQAATTSRHLTVNSKKFNMFYPAFRSGELVYSYGLSAEWGLKWELWAEFYPNHFYTPPPLVHRISDLFIPTPNTACAAYFLDVLTQNRSPHNHVLLVGPRDSGKSAVVDVFRSQAAIRTKAMQELQMNSPPPPATPGSWENPAKVSLAPPPPSSLLFLTYKFNSWLMPSHLLDGFENHMERSRKNILSAPANKTYVLLLDDVGLPIPPKATPSDQSSTLECLRHLLDAQAIFEPKTDADCFVTGLSCVATLTLRPSLPHHINGRLGAKFTPVGMTSVLDADMTKVLTGITTWLAQSRNLAMDYTQMATGLVKATIRLYYTCADKFRTSPKCPHYLFGLTDLVHIVHLVSRDCPATTVSSDKSPIVRLWCHEATRHFHDRLVSAADSMAFFSFLRDICVGTFGVTMEALFPTTVSNSISVAGFFPNSKDIGQPSPAMTRRNSRANHGSIDKLNVTNLQGGPPPQQLPQQPHAAQPLSSHMYANFQRLCFTDVADRQHYVEVSDVMAFEGQVVDELAKLTDTPARPNGLHLDVDVSTTYAMEHVLRLHRLLTDYAPPTSAVCSDHVLLLGRPGTGKSSLARLAAAVLGVNVMYLNLQAPNLKTYAQWRAALNEVLIKVVSDNKPMVLIVKDALLDRPECLEDMSSFVNGNVVPEFLFQKDIEALGPSLRENAKDQSVFLENPLAVETFCIHRIQHLLKVVVVLTTATNPSGLQAALTQHDHLLRRCRVHYMDMWPDDTFMAIARRRLAASDLTDGQVTKYGGLCLHLHRVAQPMETRTCPITPSRVLAHIVAFARQWADHTLALETRKAKLSTALATIRYVEKLANKVSTTVSDLHPAIHHMHQVSKTINVGMHTDTQAILLTQRKVEAEELIRQDIESRLAVEQGRHDVTLKAATDAFVDARGALRAVTMNDIGDFILVTPLPMIVKHLYECLGRLLQVDPVEVSDERDENTRMMDYSIPTIALLQDPMTLTTFQAYGTEVASVLPDNVLGPLTPIYESPEFIPAVLGATHAVASVLCAWGGAMINYRQTIVLLEPQETHLDIERSSLKSCAARCDALHRTLREQTAAMEQTKSSREEAEAQVRDLASKLSDHSTAIEKAEVVLAAMGGFVKKWKLTYDDLMESTDRLAGDLLVSTGLLMYGSHLTAFGRRQLLLQWMKALRRLNQFTSDGLLLHSPHHAVSDLLVEPMHMQRWLAQGVPDDMVCRENAAFLSSGELVPLVIDPHRIAFNWIMSRDMSESKTPLVLWPTLDNVAAVEADMFHAAFELRPVVFPSIDHIVKSVTLPLLLARRHVALHGASKPNVLAIQDTLIEFPALSSLYLFTTDVNAASLPLFASLVHCIHVEMTPQVCVDLFRAEFVCNSSKHTAHHWKELRLSAVDFDFEAKRFEDQCLAVLATAKSEDTIFAESAKLFEWRTQHRDAVDRFDQVQNELADAKYLPFSMDVMVQRFCGVCLAFDDLRHLRPVYGVTVSYLVSLLTHVIDVVGRDNAVALVDKFTNTAYRVLHWSVYEPDRLLVDFLFALRLHRSSEMDNHPIPPRDDMLTQESCDNESDDEDGDKDDEDNEDDSAGGGADADLDAVAAASSAAWYWALSSAPEFRFFVQPTSHPTQFLSITCPSWIPATASWDAFTAFCFILTPQTRQDIIKSFKSELKFAWKEFVESPNTTRLSLPVDLSPLHRLCVVRVLRPDALGAELMHFAKATLSMSVLSTAFTWTVSDTAAISSCKHPLVIVASRDSDGIFGIRAAAAKTKADVVMASLQPSTADGALDKVLVTAAKTGQWVVLRNADANSQWIAAVDNVYKVPYSFDYILTPYRRWTLQRSTGTFVCADSTAVDSDGLRLCFLHALLMGRQQYGALGWKGTFEIETSDFESLVHDHLDPLSHVYGVKVTSSWDLSMLGVVMQGYYDGSHRNDWAQIIPQWASKARQLGGTAGALMQLLHRASIADFNAAPSLATTPSAAPKLSLTASKLPDMPFVDDSTWFGLSKAARDMPLMAKTSEFVAALQRSFHAHLQALPSLSTKPVMAIDDQAVTRSDVQHYNTFEKMLEAMQLGVEGTKCPILYEFPLHAVVHRELAGFRTIRHVLVTHLSQLQAELAEIHAAAQVNLTPLPWLRLARSTESNFTTFQLRLLRQMRYFESWVQVGPPPQHWLGAFLVPKQFSRGTGIALQAMGLKTSLYNDTARTDDIREYADHSTTNLPSVVVTGIDLVGVHWDGDGASPDKKLVTSAAGAPTSVRQPLTLRLSAFVVTEYESLFDDAASRPADEIPLPIFQSVVANHKGGGGAKQSIAAVTSLDSAWYERLPVEPEQVGVLFVPSAVSVAEALKRGAYFAIGE
ncbi:hypothetical protein B5M09_000006 [Aphanomyces astaci]|uniref:AAA+ ATPase domain-containing protein n=1 Tax=Aphanomyces astaci TaxID=112090 RepID=A0A3R7XX77_APHAT|nr:hypothetical protein B5M09_000006 [Aphanomyces astaci]